MRFRLELFHHLTSTLNHVGVIGFTADLVFLKMSADTSSSQPLLPPSTWSGFLRASQISVMNVYKTGSRSSGKYGTVSGAQALVSAESQPTVPPVNEDNGRLQRGLSARQVQMIAIAGTIGTGLFLGTGSSLAHGGPASMLVCYTIIGFIVYVTLLLLGEMATQYPISGSFGTYCTRFLSPSYGFALAWNYWFNDAVSVAGDLIAAQLVMSYWTDWHPWAIGLIFWFFLVGINAVHVRAYGELGKHLCQ